MAWRVSVWVTIPEPSGHHAEGSGTMRASRSGDLAHQTAAAAAVDQAVSTLPDESAQVSRGDPVVRCTAGGEAAENTD
jgi:hypothetical protein